MWIGSKKDTYIQQILKNIKLTRVLKDLDSIPILLTLTITRAYVKHYLSDCWSLIYYFFFLAITSAK